MQVVEMVQQQPDLLSTPLSQVLKAQSSLKMLLRNRQDSLEQLVQQEPGLLLLPLEALRERFPTEGASEPVPITPDS